MNRSQPNWKPFTSDEELPWGTFYVAGCNNNNSTRCFTTLMHCDDNGNYHSIDPDFYSEYKPDEVTITHWAHYYDPEYPDDEDDLEYADIDDPILNELFFNINNFVSAVKINDMNQEDFVTAIELLEEVQNYL